MRVYGQVLVFDSISNSFRIPFATSNIAIFVNGLRFAENIDYQITQSFLWGKILRPLHENWPQGRDTVVLIDYDP